MQTRSRHAASAICILHLAFAAGCAKAPPTVAPSPPIAAATPAQTPIDILTLGADILAATQRAGVQRATWGIVVHSLDRNDRIFELNPRALLVPASVAKLVSVATAIDAVGWNYRFETTLRTNGTISDGTLHGDLLIVGSGDPSIGGRGGDDVGAWIEALKAAGIRRIDGRVIGDDNAIEEPRPALAWAWDDLGYPTGAIFGALNYGENRTVVSITPAATPGGSPALALDPTALGRPLVNRTTTGAPGSPPLLWPEQRPGDTALTITGSIPVGGATARLSISSGNPTAWFASVFRARLDAGGIAVAGDAFDIDDLQPPPQPATTTLFTYRSHPLSDLVRPLLKESINVYGEAFMRLNTKPGVFPTNDAALEGLHARLASWGIPKDGEQLIDGSGLSRRDVVTPDTLLAMLRRMYDASGSSPWMGALPIAGVDGSLENRMKGTPAERNVRAKTGTMSNIRSLAGYVTTADGEHLAFVILVNNFEGAGPAALQAIDAIAVRLATFRR